MKVVVYGLTLTSSWGNGHATTYRSLMEALARLGHRIVFVEKDVEWYRSHRDLAAPDFCTVVLYEDWNAEAPRLLRLAADADAVIVGSYFPDAIAATAALLEGVRCPVLFYDIDTPVTLSALRQSGANDYLTMAMIPGFAAYLSFSGGPTLRELEEHFGAKRAVAFFCSVDADLYKPSQQRDEFRCDLSYLGTYAADRQGKLVDLLDRAAGVVPEQRFLVAGPQYPPGCIWQPNVRMLSHVPPPDHPSFYSSSRYTLNLTRKDMVAAGYSPSVRLFEASACGVATLSDDWAGLGDFLTPGDEILVPSDAVEVATILREMPDEERRRIGSRARERILAEHTSMHRARELEAIISDCG